MNTRKLMRIKALWQLPKKLRYKATIRLMYLEFYNNKNKEHIYFEEIMKEIMKGRKYQ